MDLMEQARRLLDAEAEVKRLDEALKEAKAARDQINDALTQCMVDEEVQSVNVAGKLLYLRSDIQASYNKEIEDRFFDTLEAHGYGAIIKPTVNNRTLKASVRELIEQNDGVLPPWLEGMVNIFTKTAVSIKKA